MSTVYSGQNKSDMSRSQNDDLEISSFNKLKIKNQYGAQWWRPSEFRHVNHSCWSRSLHNTPKTPPRKVVRYSDITCMWKITWNPTNNLNIINCQHCYQNMVNNGLQDLLGMAEHRKTTNVLPTFLAKAGPCIRWHDKTEDVWKTWNYILLSEEAVFDYFLGSLGCSV